MPRTNRLVPYKAAMHIMCRGNNKQAVFNDDYDKLRYYRFVLELKDENKITIFHYCLMNNHIHMIIWIDEQTTLSRFMKQITLRYFSYYHRKYNYHGHLWQGRFKSAIIDESAYLLQCGKYIELNPVRANMVNCPELYIFSSYNHYAKGLADAIITDSPEYIGLSKNPDVRRKLYSEFVIGDVSGNVPLI